MKCASGARCVSIHPGGGGGIDYSQHAGMVIVCDGTAEAAKRIERALWNDPGERRDAVCGCGVSRRGGLRSGVWAAVVTRFLTKNLQKCEQSLHDLRVSLRSHALSPRNRELLLDPHPANGRSADWRGSWRRARQARRSLPWFEGACGSR